jgi:hypothetical protein
MKLAAVIVENRSIINVPEVIDRHRKFMPEGVHIYGIQNNQIKTANDYNQLLTSESFWNDYKAYDRVLIFQHDSGLLRHGIGEFLDFDYYGAPWKFAPYRGNGGLSIRNPKAMIDTIRKTPYQGMSVHGNEDVYFCNHLVGRLAPLEICSQFSVESIYKLGTFGYHAISAHLTKQQCDSILNQYI